MGFFFGKKKGESPTPGLETGWQFYSKPTSTDPPGTIFRIDPHGVRYAVDKLDVKIENSVEGGGKTVHSGKTSVSIFARFLDATLIGAEAKGDKTNKLEFEINEPQLERTTDVEIKKVIDPYLVTFNFKQGNRYFIIREARSASSMTYRITEGQLVELGGKGTITADIGAGATVGNQKDGLQEIHQKFPERMRVMFLPEEIAPIGANLGTAGPKLGLLPVRETLEWREPTEISK